MTKFTGVGVGDGEGDAVTDPRGVGETTGDGVDGVFVELLLQPPVAMMLSRNTRTALAASERNAVNWSEFVEVFFIVCLPSTAGDQSLRFLPHRVVRHLAINRVANRSRPVDEKRAWQADKMQRRTDALLGV